MVTPSSLDNLCHGKSIHKWMMTGGTPILGSLKGSPGAEALAAPGPMAGAGQRDGQRGGTPRRLAARDNGRRHGPSSGEA